MTGVGIGAEKSVRAMKRVSVTVDEHEVHSYRRILEEEGGEGALEFIREVLEEKVKASELPHCLPLFDAGYNPGQADAFKKR